MNSDQNSKIIPIWPICLYCKYILTISSFTINTLNNINYKCACNYKDQTILLQKYIYG